MKQHPKFTNLKVTKDGRVWSNWSLRFLSLVKSSTGYLKVYNKDTKVMHRVHRLVAETYLTDSEHYGLGVNHKNGVKEDNTLSNLEWCTRSHNIRHAHNTGLNNSFGEGHWQATLSDEVVHSICKLLQDGARNKDVAELFSVDKDHIAAIRSGVIWKRISSQYDITKNRNNRCSTETVRRVCKLLESGMSPPQVSRELGSSSLTYKDVLRIRNKETWVSISKEYNIPEGTQLKRDGAAIICRMLEAGESVKEICKRTNYTFDQVYKISKRVTWVSVSENYKF